MQEFSSLQWIPSTRYTYLPLKAAYAARTSTISPSWGTGREGAVLQGERKGEQAQMETIAY